MTVMPRSFPGRDHVYDVLIVGAGIAGSEAAYRCARAGLDVGLITTSLDTVYTVVGDSVTLTPPPETLMAEVLRDAGTEIGNWALHRAVKYALEHTPGIHLLQSTVSSLMVTGNQVTGVTTWEGVARQARCTVLCVGSFLQARLTIGQLTETAGRLSEMAYDDLYLDLRAKGFTFVPLQLIASESSGSLRYTVDCQVFAPEEFTGFKLKRLDNLFAAGVCAQGYIPFEAAAQAGIELADSLIGTNQADGCL
jgi:2-polyprenyl-6-methoxyphenol hydroxylase-like FAD-dependent oxidoreductase